MKKSLLKVSSISLVSFIIFLCNKSYAAVYRGNIEGDAVIGILFVALIVGIPLIIIGYFINNYKNGDDTKKSAKMKGGKIGTGGTVLIILGGFILLFIGLSYPKRLTNDDCRKIYNQDFQYRFGDKIIRHEVKYSDKVNSCVAYVELKQYIKSFNNYLLEYEIYEYKNGDMDRIFSKYISIPNLNSSLNERNSLIQQVYNYYNNL